ncbi:hypothetical protein CR513_40490, partial [Mucuna pruriens]
MNLPSFGYLVTHLITLLFVSSIVCVMSIFLHKNVSSSMHNLLNVLFLVIHLVKRALCIMILTLGLQHNMTLSILQLLFCHCFLTFLQDPIKIISWLLLQYWNLNKLIYAIVHAFVRPKKVPCPPSVKPLGSKFVFSIKLY